MTYQNSLFKMTNVDELRAQLRDITMTDSELREMVSSGLKEEEVEAVLRARAKAVNAGVLVTAQKMTADKQVQLEGDLARREAAESSIDMTPERKLARRGVNETRMSMLGWMGMIWGWLKASVFVAFGGILFAYLINKAGISLAYSENLWLCLVAVSPVWITSQVVYKYLCMPQEHAARGRRIQRWYRFGLMIFALWTMLAVPGYLGANGGLSGAASEDFSNLLDDTVTAAPVAWLGQVFDVMDMIFGDGVIGTLAVIIHLIADVVLAGSILAGVDHDWKKSRSPVEKADDSVRHGYSQLAMIQPRIDPLQEELSALGGITAEIAAKTEEFVSLSSKRIAAFRVKNNRMRVVAEAIADNFFADGKDVADMVTIKSPDANSTHATMHSATGKSAHSFN
ncbi:hypothetical protein [uncultured Sulfitobacter sp.]|uniref:hypothetical protein n=1 Tax=uncultured Sulfitobacter sp. TaxID=191468 RepID=UPI00262D6D07|nr:hypothetical protein [uncultured Sulfitobacter sp.]